MGVDNLHPDYVAFLPDWQLTLDCLEGERTIKSRGTLYLPPTAGMVEFGLNTNQPESLGYQMYQAYLTRALFPSFLEDAGNALLGIMHRRPPDIQLPTAMEPLRRRATSDGESLELLLRKINLAQMVPGRLGLMVDLPAGKTTGTTPKIALYDAVSIINWDEAPELVPEKLNLVVLNESKMKRVNTFEWDQQTKYRVLTLGDPASNEPNGAYRQEIWLDTNSASQMVTPSFRGNILSEIPFTFINSMDVVPAPQKGPMLGLAYLALAVYRGEADFRQSLFMQGQDTLVVIGGEEDKTYLTGAGGTIVPPVGGDAKFIGASADGLGEQRHALENDYKRASLKAAQMTDTTSRQRESGDALRVRVAAQTATLVAIADAGAEGLERILKMIATWMGENPEQVSVRANKDFTSDMPDGSNLKDLVQAAVLGLPWSQKSQHEYIKQGGLTRMTYEEEKTQIVTEQNDAAMEAGVDSQ